MQLRKISLRIYEWLERRITPGLLHSQVLYEQTLQRYVRPDTHWLDLGCGHELLPAWRRRQELELVGRCARIVGIDMDLVSLRKPHSIRMKLMADGQWLPFAGQSFDLVTANMVVEHLAQPAAMLREVRRVLRPGGVFIFHTPNLYGVLTLLNRMTPEALKHKLIYLIDGRHEDDVFPTFYQLNCERAINHLAGETGLDVQALRLVTTTGLPVLGLAPPLCIAQLAAKRLALHPRLRTLRSNIIAVLTPAEQDAEDMSIAKAI